MGKINDMAKISLFVALMSVCAWICIPAPVPFTLQTLGVFLTVGLIGGKRASVAFLIYLLLGAFGAPVFSLGSSGIGVLFGSSGGYMMSWLVIGILAWALDKYIKKSAWAFTVTMVIGLFLCYALGTAWYVFVYMGGTGNVGYISALSVCVLPFIIPDILKLILAVILRKRLSRFI